MTTVQPLPSLTVEEVARFARWRLAMLSALGGLILAVVWSPRLVDTVIGGHIANPVVGGDARTVSITGTAMALLFAFITGVAGSFTACNIAVFGALAPMSAQSSVGRRVTGLMKPIGLLALGSVVVAGLYGAIGVYIGESIPQLSNATIGDHNIRVRSSQSGVVFSVIGIILVWHGLAALRLVRSPLSNLFHRRPAAELVFMGGLVGAFLIGRPFGMFRHLYEYAAKTDNPLLGFATFALQSIGNIVIVSLLFAGISLATRSRFQRWLTATPSRLAQITAVSFIVAGAFFIAYWGIKLGARAGLLWWPTMPYN
ncbi:MAG TPA: hypothetical protein VGJ95_11420 [Pseudonocardiaceae bacterium]